MRPASQWSGYTVEITSLDTGRKVTVKTDKGGNYY